MYITVIPKQLYMQKSFTLLLTFIILVTSCVGFKRKPLQKPFDITAFEHNKLVEVKRDGIKFTAKILDYDKEGIQVKEFKTYMNERKLPKDYAYYWLFDSIESIRLHSKARTIAGTAGGTIGLAVLIPIILVVYLWIELLPEE